MAATLSEITEDIAEWLRAQPMFFVATAPHEGHVNVSPKGYDTFRVLEEHRVAYLDLTGSGVETIAHIRENGRVTLMFCAFSGNPRICRIYGLGRALEIGTPEFEVLAPNFEMLPGTRAIIDVAVSRVSTSCGYAVPLMDLVEDRDRLQQWARGGKGDDVLVEYRAGKERDEHRRLARLGAVSYSERVVRARGRMEELDVDVLLLSVGADLPYLTGYEAMPLERLTMFVLPRSGDARLVVPRLEAPRVTEQPDVFEIVGWEETEDPVELVAKIAGTPRRAAIGDQTWARFVLELQQSLPVTEFVPAVSVVGPLRIVKDEADIAALRRAAAPVDVVAAEMRSRPFAGRTELDVHRELVERMLAEGHERANFAIVAAGEHATSPHHEPSGERTIVDGDIVLCDFGGTMHRYCSDITRMFHVGAPSREVGDAYTLLTEAQEAAFRAATVGTHCEAVDTAARDVIASAGFGEYFVHRVGHGIGCDAHEDPYMVAGNRLPIEAGHAFSIEPGIYVPGRFGMRLEDIVVATTAGPERLNDAARDLALVG